jgi:hypothetical protein
LSDARKATGTAAVDKLGNVHDAGSPITAFDSASDPIFTRVFLFLVSILNRMSDKKNNPLLMLPTKK